MSALTETEAQTKWCPFARCSVFNDGEMNAPSFNRLRGHDAKADSPVEARCIASACMAWRWGRDANGDVAYQRTPVKDSPGHFDNAPQGYCGLVGRPA